MSGYLQKPGSGGGVESLNALTGAVTLSAGNNITLNETGNDILFSANFTQQGKYMISGGAVWSGTGLTYDVSIISYFFNGVKSGSQASVTLDPSDPTFNRLDSIVIDEAGTISVITGVPSASPVTPPIPEDQLEVQIVLVEAGSTTPTIQSENIYLDNPTSNWTFSTYTTGTATGSIDFAGTNSPKQGVNDIEASTDPRLGARFVRSTSFDPYQYTMMSVWVRFTGTAVATNKSLNVRFENSAGTLVGSNVNLFSFGLSRSILNTWQLVVVPITAFGALPTTVKGLKVIMAGGTVGVVRQWDIDYMILTNGSVPFANVPTIAFYKDNVGIASQSGLNIKQGTGMTITAVNNPLTQTVDYTFDSAGVTDGDKGDITVSGTGSIWTVDNSAITLGKISSSGASSGNAIVYNGSSIVWGTPAAPITVDAVNNNIYSGTISAGSALAGTTGATLLGYQAGQNLTTAIRGVMIGYTAGKGISTGSASIVAIGSAAGLNANTAANSVFIGSSAGSGATSTMTNAIAIGQNAMLGSTGVNSFSISLGRFAGTGLTANAQYGIFIGDNAGNGATSASNAIFLGQNAGYQATGANNTIAIGNASGYQNSAAVAGVFIGYGSGATATSASYANMIGRLAGNAAANAQYSNFIGFQAGYNATNAANSIFIGKNAGYADTVNNVGSGSSILIGESTSTGGYKDSIAIGKLATNTATNQMQIGSSSSKINTVVINGTGGIQVPVGTTAERSATQGTIRYNTDTSKFEGYDGSTWVDLN